MSSKVLLQRGYCTKSPPNTLWRNKHRWRKRFCTLSRETIPDMEEFHSKYNNDYDKTGICNLDPSLEYLVFSYYENEADEMTDKPIRKFIIDSSWNSAVFDYPIGVDDFTYVIKVLLGPLYNGREMFLCIEEKEEHEQWLRAFDTCPDEGTMETMKFLELEVRASSIKYKPPSLSSQEHAQKMLEEPSASVKRDISSNSTKEEINSTNSIAITTNNSTNNNDSKSESEHQ